jgi:uncharacterized oligopeptide transporter (OPT) family protein
MLTIIIASVFLLRAGLTGQAGMFFVMAIAGMVCTALSLSGQLVTDLKAGYWLGSTPAIQEQVKFLGILAAAAAAGLTIAALAHGYQFGEAVPGDPRPVLPSPQAAIMKTLVEGFMNRQPVAYALFVSGAFIALIMEMLGVPALIFALGLYLPLELNTPALVGGFLAHFLTKRSEAVGGERGGSIRERGVVIASGLMAGGALGGLFGAALRLLPSPADPPSVGRWYSEVVNLLPRFAEDRIKSPFYDNAPVAQSVSALLFVSLCVYVWQRSLSEPKEA